MYNVVNALLLSCDIDKSKPEAEEVVFVVVLLLHFVKYSYSGQYLVILNDLLEAGQQENEVYEYIKTGPPDRFHVILWSLSYLLIQDA